jgi:hypothetical protein
MALPNLVQSPLILSGLSDDNAGLLRLVFPVTLASLVDALVIVQNYGFGFPVDIRQVRFVATTPATTPGASIQIIPTIGTAPMLTDASTTVSGGTLELTTGGCGAGEITVGAHITGNNRLGIGSTLTLTVEATAPLAAFTEGAGYIEVMAYNLAHRHVLSVLKTLCDV